MTDFENDDDFGKTLAIQRLVSAAASGNAGRVKASLAWGVPVDSQLQDGDGTALHQSVVCQHPAIVALLLEHGADAEVRCHGGETPLEWAAWYGEHGEAQEVLRRHIAREKAENLSDAWLPPGNEAARPRF